MSRTTYGNNGQPEYRDDYKGKPHYDKKQVNILGNIDILLNIMIKDNL